MITGKTDTRGLFITFEGIDYSGKSVQSRILLNKFLENNYSAVIYRDPGATSISEKIRAILLDNKNIEMSSRTELLLYEAARAQMVEEVISPALTTGKIVVCDRFYDSTTAYQGYGRQLDIETINSANMLGACGVIPDITFVIDIPVEISVARRIAVAEKADRLEAEGLEFQNRVRNGFLQIAENNRDRVFVINGQDSVDSISNKIDKIIRERFHIIFK